MKPLRIAFVVVILLISQVDVVSAWRCFKQRSVSDELSNSTAVFAGQAILEEYRPVNSNETYLPADGKVLVIKFAVERWWKGSGEEEIVLRTGVSRFPNGVTHLFSEDFTFEVGRKYLVYAFGSGEDLKTNGCSRTAKLELAEADLQELGLGKFPEKKPPPGKGSTDVVRITPSPSPSPTAPMPDKQGSTTSTQNEEEVGEGEVLRISANLVSVPVTVMNRDGQYVVDLRRQDFRVFENGVEQPIVHFSNVDQPFSVVLLIDTSGSTAPFIDQIKSAAKAFVDQLRASDTVRPVFFHGEIKSLTTEGVNDRKLFDAALDRIEPGPINMGTRLYDAVTFGLNALKPVAARKAIILITDGENTWGKSTVKSTLRDAEESDVVVYTLQYGDLVPQKYLQQLSEKTGGRYFKGADINTITRSFVNVADELRRQYVLGYHPNDPSQGGLRKIRVKVNRDKVAVRARQSYTYTR